MRAAILIAALALSVTPVLAQAKTKSTVPPEAPAVETPAPEAPMVETQVPDAPAVEAQPPAPEGATPAATSGESASVQMFKTCLNYARGDGQPVEAAKGLGWEAYEDLGESPFVKTYSANKTFAGVGDAALFSLVESYPNTTFGYCRIDIQGPTGQADVNALNDLPELAGGQVITNGDGTFGTWEGTEAEPQLLLLSHQTANVYVLQMTILTHRDGPAEAK